MELTTRSLWSIIHGMGFGGLYLLFCSGALVELWRRYAPSATAPITTRDERFLRLYLITMTVLAWVAVLTGAYVVYPWYRAVPAAGAIDLAGFPQRLLISSPHTAAWHSLGMEWKEHVAWLAPISITMAATVFLQYGRNLRLHPQLRNAVLTFTAASFLAAGIAGFFGAEIDDHAPVRGGATIHLVGGAQP